MPPCDALTFSLFVASEFLLVIGAVLSLLPLAGEEDALHEQMRFSLVEVKTHFLKFG